MQKIVVRKDVYDEIMGKMETEDIEKSRIPKYIKKIPLGDGNFKYIYSDDKQRPLKSRIDYVVGTLLKCTKSDAKQKGEKFLKDWQDDWEKNPEKSRIKVFGGEKVYLKTKGGNKISLFHFSHKGGGKSRAVNEIYQRALLLPVAKKMLEEDKCCINEVRKYNDRVEYELVGKIRINNADRIVSVIISKMYGKKKVYISTINKAVSENDTAFITDVYFVDPKMLTSQTKLNLGIPVDESRQSKTLSGNALETSGKQRSSASGNYTIRQPKHNLNIPQSTKKSTIKPDYNGDDMLHKSFDITVADITEKNKQKKIEQVEKALTAIYQKQPFAIRHIKADRDSDRYDDIILRISSFDKSKIQKAVHKMAFTLDTKIKSAKGEAFIYKAQEELTDRIVSELTEKTKAVYSFLIGYLGLPEVRIISKADLKYKGKIIYDPESGEPISQAEWKRFIDAVEKFLNRNYAGTGKKIVLSAESLGRILERLSKTNSFEAVKKMPLSNLKYGGKSFDWISDDIKNLKNALGESIDRSTQARIQIAVDSAAQRVSSVTDTMRNDIQQIVIDGIKNRQSKAKISQNLFDKCSGLNRDFQRIADTEIQNNTNNAYIKEEVYNTPEDEKVYFKRFEMKDDNTCKKCRAIAGKIALFSNIPLPSEEIDDPYADYAIWEGKTDGAMPMGVMHPYCRGSWYRYYPEIK